jgi:hypothetical protein
MLFRVELFPACKFTTNLVKIKEFTNKWSKWYKMVKIEETICFLKE